MNTTVMGQSVSRFHAVVSALGVNVSEAYLDAGGEFRIACLEGLSRRQVKTLLGQVAPLVTVGASGALGLSLTYLRRKCEATP